MLKKFILFTLMLIFIQSKSHNPILPYIYFEDPNSIYEPQCREYADIVVTDVMDDANHYLNAGYNNYYSY